mmetsp:Transcript_38910/g.62359  ORF Transcript_38910/g.62359 Transcript_38910/m.62359 type:complete len:270 (-) Transcript_38910:334-1143(-)
MCSHYILNPCVCLKLTQLKHMCAIRVQDSSMLRSEKAWDNSVARRDDSFFNNSLNAQRTFFFLLAAFTASATTALVGRNTLAQKLSRGLRVRSMQGFFIASDWRAELDDAKDKVPFICFLVNSHFNPNNVGLHCLTTKSALFPWTSSINLRHSLVRRKRMRESFCISSITAPAASLNKDFETSLCSRLVLIVVEMRLGRFTCFSAFGPMKSRYTIQACCTMLSPSFVCSPYSSKRAFASKNNKFSAENSFMRKFISSSRPRSVSNRHEK